MSDEENSIDVMLEARKIAYLEIMQNFIEYKEWDDEFTLNEEMAQITLQTELPVNGQLAKLFLELNYDNDMVDAYIYYGFRCKNNKMDEMARLLNEIHLRYALGRFEFLPDGQVRWHHRVDFEGSSPTGVSVAKIVEPGWHSVRIFFDTIAAVAMTNQTAAEVIREYDEAKAEAAARAESNDGAPTEL